MHEVLIAALLVFGILLWACSSKQEHMAYLDQYETQDNWRNVPESWPIPYTSTTALFAARRNYLDQLLPGRTY